MPAVRLQLADGSTYHHEGKIDAVSGVIDQSTGSVSMRAIFLTREMSYEAVVLVILSSHIR